MEELISGNLITVITIPVIAALIGWITNYLAVKMIFRPRKRIRVIGFTIQGLVPKRQKELAASIGETVQRDLVSHKDVQDVLHSPEIEAEISLMIGQQIDRLITKTLGGNPMIAMFLQGNVLNQIRETLLEQLKSAIPEFMERITLKVETSLDFKQIVQSKIESFDLSQLEDIIYRISAKELKMIEILGGVLGFIVGIFQVAIMLLSGR